MIIVYNQLLDKHYNIGVTNLLKKTFIVKNEKYYLNKVYYINGVIYKKY
jgi:hypothetical protein